LNPDEYLNCDLKAGVHSGAPARSKSQLKSKALRLSKKYFPQIKFKSFT